MCLYSFFLSLSHTHTHTRSLTLCLLLFSSHMLVSARTLHIVARLFGKRLFAIFLSQGCCALERRSMWFPELSRARMRIEEQRDQTTPIARRLGQRFTREERRTKKDHVQDHDRCSSIFGTILWKIFRLPPYVRTYVRTYVRELCKRKSNTLENKSLAPCV